MVAFLTAAMQMHLQAWTAHGGEYIRGGGRREGGEGYRGGGRVGSPELLYRGDPRRRSWGDCVLVFHR
jgi:hypothetical protein